MWHITHEMWHVTWDMLAQLCHIWKFNWSHDTNVPKFPAIGPSSPDPCGKENYLRKGLRKEGIIGVCLLQYFPAWQGPIYIVLVTQFYQQWHVLSHIHRTCDMWRHHMGQTKTHSNAHFPCYGRLQWRSLFSKKLCAPCSIVQCVLCALYIIMQYAGITVYCIMFSDWCAVLAACSLCSIKTQLASLWAGASIECSVV